MLNKKRILCISLAFLILGLILLPFINAEEGASLEETIGITFFWIAVILIAAKFSSLIERIGQPAVLGELIIGVILGNLALIGINIFEPIKSDIMIEFLAQLGVVILLFQNFYTIEIHKYNIIPFLFGRLVDKHEHYMDNTLNCKFIYPDFALSSRKPV